MARNIRVSLSILTVGFAVEGAGGAYSVLGGRSLVPMTSFLLLLPVTMTLVGLLFLAIGRHEWGEVHEARVHRSNVIFGLSLLAGVVAATEAGALAAYPSFGIPLWAVLLFGAATGSFLLGTFVTYAHLVFHMVTTPSKVALVASAVWALAISTFIGETLAADLPSIVGLIEARSFALEGLASPVGYLASFLFVSYFLLLGAYVDAHLTVTRRQPAALRTVPRPLRN
jgi:hypothetical protein